MNKNFVENKFGKVYIFFYKTTETKRKDTTIIPAQNMWFEDFALSPVRNTYIWSYVVLLRKHTIVVTIPRNLNNVMVKRNLSLI